MEEDKPQEILTVSETAKLLRISRYATYKLAKEGKIPAFWIGNKWRFNKAKVLEAVGKGSPKE